MEELKVLKNLTLLYAEDDEVIIESTKNIFEIFFEKVITVEDGAKALEAFNKEVVHIIVLDIKMPIINGLEVAKEIREVDKDIPIFITTSFLETEVLLKAVKLNLVEYIVKPIEFSKIKDALLESVKRLSENRLFFSTIDENIKYNQLSKTIIKERSEIKLSKREAKLLELLLRNRGKLMEKEFLEDELFSEKAKDNSLKNLIYSLRKKIDSNKIVNIKDSGYLLKEI